MSFAKRTAWATPRELRAGDARRDASADRPQVAKIAQVMRVSVTAMYRSRRVIRPLWTKTASVLAGPL